MTGKTTKFPTAAPPGAAEVPKEEYAALARGGYAYAVHLRSGGKLKLHSSAPLEEVLTAWATGAESGAPLAFHGAPDGTDEDEENGHETSTGAGAVLAREVVAVAYWSPLDDAAPDAAYEAAGALLSALADGAAAAQGGGDAGLRV